MEKNMTLETACVVDDELHIDLWYPSVEENTVKKFVIGLMDVRAVDNIRVSFDRGRNGWMIEQASVFEWDEDDSVCDSKWVEVAFVEAWASSEKETGDEKIHGVHIQ